MDIVSSQPFITYSTAVYGYHLDLVRMVCVYRRILLFLPIVQLVLEESLEIFVLYFRYS